MHTSAVDRATTTTTSINSRTGLEGSRLQAWPGTAKENGQHHHHGHANLRSFLLLHEEGAFSFYDVRHDGEFLHCSLPLAREVVSLASCFSCGVARAEIDDASKNTHVLFTTTQFSPIATYDLQRCCIFRASRGSHFPCDGSFHCVH
jgi:hypothetical protein